MKKEQSLSVPKLRRPTLSLCNDIFNAFATELKGDEEEKKAAKQETESQADGSRNGSQSGLQRQNNSFRSFKSAAGDSDDQSKDCLKEKVMNGLDFVKMAKVLKLYPDYVPFEIVKEVVQQKENNRFTIDEFQQALTEMIERRNLTAGSGEQVPGTPTESLTFVKLMMKLNIQY